MLPVAVENVATKLTILGTVKLVGSNSFRGMLFPSDVDLQSPMGPEDAVHKFFVKLFKGSDYKKGKFLFMDFKCGLDHKFLKLEDETDEELVARTKKLIPKATLSLMKKARGDAYKDLVDELKIIRWTPDEIVKGSKILADGSVKTFQEALKDESIIKLDVAVPSGFTFFDVTEVYSFRKKSKEAVVKELESDVDHYADKNSLKAMKRLYSLLILENKHKKTQKELVEIFNSPLGARNKLFNDIQFFLRVTGKHEIDEQRIEENLQLFKQTYFGLEDSKPLYAKKLDRLDSYRKTLTALSEDLRVEINREAKLLFKQLKF